VAVLLLSMDLFAQQEPTYTIRVDTDLVQISVVARDRNGRFIPDLTRDDFILREDGRSQPLAAIDLEMVGSEQNGAAPTQLPILTSATPLPSSVARGLRLIVLFFDFTTLEPDDAARAVRAAEAYVATIGRNDRVAVVTLLDKLEVQQDFTADQKTLREAIQRLHGVSRAIFDAEPDADLPEDALFTGYRRLRSLRLLTSALAQAPQKKSVVIFAGSGFDADLAGITATVDAAVRAGVSFYGIDAAGLSAAPPLGDASRGSSFGTGVLSGVAVVQGGGTTHDQDLLYALARGTGGRAYFDSNDFERPFRTLEDDTGEYYLLSYRSTNTRRDGRFRRIEVRVHRPQVRVTHQAGYYAPKDAMAVSAEQRERQFQEELAADLPSQEVPLYVALAYMHAGAERFYVPTTVLLPSSLSSEKNPAENSFEIAVIFRNTESNAKQMVRQTIPGELERGSQSTMKVIQYSTGAMLPSGAYKVRVVVRENASGKIGAFDTTIDLPKVAPERMIIGPILSGWKKAVHDSSAQNPLADKDHALVPNPLARYTTSDAIALRYELSARSLAEPEGAGQRRTDQLKSALECFKGGDRVFRSEPLLPQQLQGDTAVVQAEIPAGALTSGSYVCQVTAIDEDRRQFAFARTHLVIRAW
jgi:VWFA-related protein